MKDKFKIPPLVKSIVERIEKRGFKAYIVGGIIRDMLLKRRLGDFDIATDAKPRDIMRIFKKTIPTGIKHGTVTVIEGGRSFEITTFRSEGGYTDARRPDRVTFIDNLLEDLSRRDFSVNAMAYDVRLKELIDPFNGLRDLKKKTIQTVGDPYLRFNEDALRALRAARFASVLGFKIERRTYLAIPKVLGKIKMLSKERVRDELMKILSSKKPSVGLRILYDTGILKLFIPELTETAKFDQGGQHEYDLLTHSFYSADNSPVEKPTLRLTALLHDIGKPVTRTGKDGDYRFYGHELKGALMVEKVLRRLKFSNKEIDYVRSMTKNHMFNYNSHWKDGAIRRLLNRVGVDHFSDLIKLRVADIHACGEGRIPPKQLKELEKRAAQILRGDHALKLKDLKVNGNDVMRILKIRPSKAVGEILNKLLNVVLEDNTRNTKRELTRLIKSMGNYCD